MIIERLQIIIAHYQLTPSVLADSIGVPRSSISHLLSGRNKPSLDFVLKLVDKYPEVDLYWLLYGEGEFLEQTDTKPKSNLNKRGKMLNQTQNSSDKRIKQIVVFYQDGTFATYQPSI